MNHPVINRIYTIDSTMGQWQNVEAYLAYTIGFLSVALFFIWLRIGKNNKRHGDQHRVEERASPTSEPPASGQPALSNVSQQEQMPQSPSSHIGISELAAEISKLADEISRLHTQHADEMRKLKEESLSKASPKQDIARIELKYQAEIQRLSERLREADNESRSLKIAISEMRAAHRTSLENAQAVQAAAISRLRVELCEETKNAEKRIKAVDTLAIEEIRSQIRKECEQEFHAAIAEKTIALQESQANAMQDAERTFTKSLSIKDERIQMLQDRESQLQNLVKSQETELEARTNQLLAREEDVARLSVMEAREQSPDELQQSSLDMPKILKALERAQDELRVRSDRISELESNTEAKETEASLNKTMQELSQSQMELQEARDGLAEETGRRKEQDQELASLKSRLEIATKSKDEVHRASQANRYDLERQRDLVRQRDATIQARTDEVEALTSTIRQLEANNTLLGHDLLTRNSDRIDALELEIAARDSVIEYQDGKIQSLVEQFEEARQKMLLLEGQGKKEETQGEGKAGSKSKGNWADDASWDPESALKEFKWRDQGTTSPDTGSGAAVSKSTKAVSDAAEELRTSTPLTQPIEAVERPGQQKYGKETGSAPSIPGQPRPGNAAPGSASPTEKPTPKPAGPEAWKVCFYCGTKFYRTRNGQDDRMVRAKFHKHIAECKARYRRCENEGCGKVMPSDEFYDQHLAACKKESLAKGLKVHDPKALREQKAAREEKNRKKEEAAGEDMAAQGERTSTTGREEVNPTSPVVDPTSPRLSLEPPSSAPPPPRSLELPAARDSQDATSPTAARTPPTAPKATPSPNADAGKPKEQPARRQKAKLILPARHSTAETATAAVQKKAETTLSPVAKSNPAEAAPTASSSGKKTSGGMGASKYANTSASLPSLDRKYAPPHGPQSLYAIADMQRAEREQASRSGTSPLPPPTSSPTLPSSSSQTRTPARPAASATAASKASTKPKPGGMGAFRYATTPPSTSPVAEQRGPATEQAAVGEAGAANAQAARHPGLAIDPGLLRTLHPLSDELITNRGFFAIESQIIPSNHTLLVRCEYCSQSVFVPFTLTERQTPRLDWTEHKGECPVILKSKKG